MKKFNQWFNQLPATRQKQAISLFMTVFALLLCLSLRHNPITIKHGDVPQHIGRNTDSLTLKKRK